MDNPTKTGCYLACIYEWTGLAKDKPAKPHWEIKTFTAEHKVYSPQTRQMETVKAAWEERIYYFDTGNYTNLEIVAWQELPPLPVTDCKTSGAE